MQFSIIIPAKNELKNLQRVLPQFDALKGTYSYEVIIADGASDDGTIEFARTRADRVEVKTKKERETIGEGRNRGARVASGDIFIFIDAGVCIENVPNFFETIRRTFENARIVAATVNVSIDPREATWQDRLVHGAVNFVVRFWNAMGWGAGKGECQIVRAETFRRAGGYNEALVAGEDNDLYRRLARIGVVVFLNELEVYDDPRRYRKLGYARVIGQWMRNQVYVILFKRSYDSEWKRVD